MLSDIEAVLGDTPGQTYSSHHGRSKEGTRRTRRLVHSCFKTEMGQSNDVSDHLHVIPGLLMDMICSKQPHNTDSNVPGTECS